MPRTKKPQHGGKREGAGRKPFTEGVKLRDNQVTMSLSPELIAHIDKERGDTPRSAFLRAFLEKHFLAGTEANPAPPK